MGIDILSLDLGEIILAFTKGDKPSEEISMLRGNNYYFYKSACKSLLRDYPYFYNGRQIK
jgi:YHS domain-containing protein